MSIEVVVTRRDPQTPGRDHSPMEQDIVARSQHHRVTDTIDADRDSGVDRQVLIKKGSISNLPDGQCHRTDR